MTAGRWPETAAAALDRDRGWLQILKSTGFKLNGFLAYSRRQLLRVIVLNTQLVVRFQQRTFPNISLNRVFCAAAHLAKFFNGLLIHGSPLKDVSAPYQRGIGALIQGITSLFT